MAGKHPVTVDNPKDVPTPIIADAIVEIAAAMRKLSATRLSRKAIVLLVHDDTKLGKREIERVIESLEAIEATYLKKAGTP